MSKLQIKKYNFEVIKKKQIYFDFVNGYTYRIKFLSSIECDLLIKSFDDERFNYWIEDKKYNFNLYIEEFLDMMNIFSIRDLKILVRKNVDLNSIKCYVHNLIIDVSNISKLHRNFNKIKIVFNPNTFVKILNNIDPESKIIIIKEQNLGIENCEEECIENITKILIENNFSNFSFEEMEFYSDSF